MRSIAFSLSLIVLALLVGCGGGSSTKGGVHVALSPSSAVSLAVTQTQQFTATVSGTSDTAVTWSISSTGCTGAACGTVSSSGLYTAPATPPSANVVVKATLNADTNRFASVQVKIVNVTIAVAPKTASVALTGHQQFSATASPSNAPQAFTWTVTCGGSPCGSIDSTGLYTAPASLPTPSTVTITATSTIDSTGTDTAGVNLLSTFNNRLKGSYAFRFSGYDSVGPVLLVGNFAADGAGRITAGLEDISRSGGPQSLTITGGSYTVGSDNRGLLNLTTSAGTSSYKFAIGANAEAQFIEFDSTGITGSGVIDIANPGSFNKASITGSYVFEFFGADLNDDRAGYVGSLTADGAGTITGGSLDINDAGSPSALTGATGTYTVPGTGRGTIDMTVGGIAYKFAFYVVSGSQAFVISTDSPAVHPQVSGQMLAQDSTATFTIADFSGSSIFYVSGVDSTLGLSSNVMAGIATTDGNGAVTGVADQNNAGVITSNSSYTSTYAATGGGRYTITLSGISFVMYAISKNQAFLLDQNSLSVQTGMLQPQKNVPFIANSIGGSFIQSNDQIAGKSAPDVVAALALNAATGSVAGTQDETNGGQNSNQSVTGSYTVTSNGRGTFTTFSPSTTSGVLYVIDNSSFVTIEVSSGNQNSSVLLSAR